jgi:Carbohydrate-binding module 48 (Isoamylase N-terminal domain)
MDGRHRLDGRHRRPGNCGEQRPLLVKCRTAGLPAVATSNRPGQLGRFTFQPALEEPVVIKQSQAKGTNHVKVQFILPNGSIPGKVSVVGDFNGWDPAVHPLRKRSNGTRSVSVSLPAGRRYAFRYLGEDGQWLDDEHAHAFEPNGVGGVNGIIST